MDLWIIISDESEIISPEIISPGHVNPTESQNTCFIPVSSGWLSYDSEKENESRCKLIPSVHPSSLLCPPWGGAPHSLKTSAMFSHINVIFSVILHFRVYILFGAQQVPVTRSGSDLDYKPNKCLKCPDWVRLICLFQPIRPHTVCGTGTSLGLKCLDFSPGGSCRSLPAHNVQTVTDTHRHAEMCCGHIQYVLRAPPLTTPGCPSPIVTIKCGPTQSWPWLL